VLNIRVKRGVELSIDPNLLVYNLRLEKINRITMSHGIMWEAQADKDATNTFANNIFSFFRELPECIGDTKVERQLFRAGAASSAAR